MRAAAPIPGGLGAVEAALIGGLVGAGVDAAVATPAILVFRPVTNWAVVVPASDPSARGRRRRFPDGTVPG